jgi:cytochrome P450
VYQQILKETNENKKGVFSDMLSFLIGGHESSALTLLTGLYQLKKNPDVERRLKEEVSKVLSKNGFNESKK